MSSLTQGTTTTTTTTSGKKDDGSQNDLLLTKLEEVSNSAREVALFRMECLSDDNDDKVNSSSNSYNTTAEGGLSQELARLLMETLEEKEKDDGSSSSSSLRRVLQVVEDITKTDPTLAEEVARCLGPVVSGLLEERLLHVISSGGGVSSSSSSSQEEEKSDLGLLAHDITTRITDLLLVAGSDGAGVTTENDQEKNGSGGEGGDGSSSFSRLELQNRLPLLFSMPRNNDEHKQQVHNENDMKVMVHQSASLKDAQTHDVGLVMWPSAVMLARYLVENPHVVLNSSSSNAAAALNTSNTTAAGGTTTILELGAGCGLVGITAAKLVQQQNQDNEDNNNPNNTTTSTTSSGSSPNLILTDYNAQVLLNLKRNVHLNDLDKDGCTSVVGLDFFDQQPPSSSSEQEEDDKLEGKDKETLRTDDENDDSNDTNWWIDMDGTKHPQVDLILAADIICYSNDAELVANTIRTALKPNGGKAIVLGPDEDQRFGIQYFEQECYNCGLQVEVTNLNCRTNTIDSMVNTVATTTDQQEENQQLHLDHDLEQTSGFHQGYNLTMFTIECAH